MIGLATGTRVWLTAGITDLRKGFDGLSAIVQEVLRDDPFSGHVFVFRGRHGDIRVDICKPSPARLQADGYAGFHHLYETGRIQEAACWAHVRRKFFDIHQAHQSPIAKVALDRIAALYAIEKDIRGRMSGISTDNPALGR